MKTYNFGLFVLLAMFSVSCGLAEPEKKEESEPAPTQTSTSSEDSVKKEQLAHQDILTGKWLRIANSDLFTISEDGLIGSSVCETKGQIGGLSIAKCPAGYEKCGTTNVGITYYNGTLGCLPVGVHSCSYWTADSSTKLIINCGKDSISYVRQ